MSETMIPLESKICTSSFTGKEYSVLKFSENDIRKALAGISTTHNGFMITRPIYNDFLIDLCLLEPRKLFKVANDTDVLYETIQEALEEINKANPSLSVEKIFVSDKGLLVLDYKKDYPQMIDNMDWEFPAPTFKYYHGSFISLDSVSEENHHVVYLTNKNSYLIIRNLDDEELNFLFLLKEGFDSAYSYKKYFCYYSVLNFYHTYALMNNFSSVDNEEIIDDVSALVAACNPDLFFIGDDTVNDTKELFGSKVKQPTEEDFNTVEEVGNKVSKQVKKEKEKPSKTFDSISVSDIEKLESRLLEEVIGQPGAVTSIIKAIKRAKVGLKKENTPVASLIFSGSSGSGKTLTARILSECLTGSQNSLVRIDCSEYGSEYEVSKILGAPNGYVGYSEGSYLVKRIIKNPFSVLLFDEIEKAHPKFYDVLLQILGESRLTDSHNQTANFDNVIVIMTSNIGSRDIVKTFSKLGFSVSENEKASKEQRNVDNIVNVALKKHFKPEFLGRIDDIVVFNTLSKSDFKVIAQSQLKDIASRLLVKGYSVEFDPSVLSIVVEHGYSEEYGARNLDKTIKKYITDKIADLLLSKPDVKSYKVYIDSDKGLRIAEYGDVERA